MNLHFLGKKQEDYFYFNQNIFRENDNNVVKRQVHLNSRKKYFLLSFSEQLIEEITFRRRKELRTLPPETDLENPSSRSRGYSSNQNTTYWTDLFVRHFLFQTDFDADRDDLLFFIRKGATPVPGSLSKHNKQHTTVEVSDLNLCCHNLEIIEI